MTQTYEVQENFPKGGWRRVAYEFESSESAWEWNARNPSDNMNARRVGPTPMEPLVLPLPTAGKGGGSGAGGTGGSLSGLAEIKPGATAGGAGSVLFEGTTERASLHVTPPFMCAELTHPAPKPRPDLIPPDALLEVGRVLAWGFDRPNHDPYRWKKLSASEHLERATRHILQHSAGEHTDTETGRPHLAHAAARVLYALAQHLRGH